MKKEGYQIRSHKFIGRHDYPNGDSTYYYELGFNKSMEHTGKHKGICDGLNNYDKKEQMESLWFHLRMFFVSIFRVFKHNQQ